MESRFIDLAGSITLENIDKLKVGQPALWNVTQKSWVYKETAVSAITKEIDLVIS